MLRLLTASGQTASGNLSQPNVGYKWRILSAILSLSSSSTAGTRTAQLGIIMGSSTLAFPVLVSLSSDTVSTVSTATGGPNAPNASATNTIWYMYPEMRSADVVKLSVSLQTGDTVEYYLLVDEVLDE